MKKALKIGFLTDKAVKLKYQYRLVVLDFKDP